MTLPTGSHLFHRHHRRVTGLLQVIPSFNIIHATTNDGSVVWTSIGSGDIRSRHSRAWTGSGYFSSDRGQRQLQHLICLLGAGCVMPRGRHHFVRMRLWSRRRIELRKSATLHDYRLPGGLILGKITRRRDDGGRTARSSRR